MDRGGPCRRAVGSWPVIPTYNEIDHVAEVVKQALAYLPVVLIDDGSTDGSGARLPWPGQRSLPTNTTGARARP